MNIKKIAVLTSGGDAPGMNATIRSVVRTAITEGMEVVGVIRGYNGLIHGDLRPMHVRSVSGIINLGGTLLYTARSPEFATEEGMQKAIKTCHDNNIDGVVVIGGDGSFRGARDLSERGIPCVGIPGTIDNDISSSDYTIGFDTALNTAVEMVDRLRDTAQSHDRCSVVEVMGRRAGYLALRTAIAVGATHVLVPEIGYDIDEVCQQINEGHAIGKQHFIIIVAEGIGGVEQIAKDIQEKTGIESRATILGHVQRGGRPSARDRVNATRMGYHAVKLLSAGIGNRVVVMKNSKVIDYDIQEALAMTKPFENDLYDMVMQISV